MYLATVSRLLCLSLQLVDLKAALFSKQREAAKEKRQSHDGDILSTRKVSDEVKVKRDIVCC